MKISILTPTYNDSETIEETLQSILEQTYTNWEWIVINDGSTDNINEVMQTLIDKYNITDKVKYIEQENGDQLNALLNGVQYVEGEYLFILHSDDLLPSADFFEKCVKEMQQDSSCDGLLGDLIVIDENTKQTGMQYLRDYKNDDNTLALQLLWLGRNLFADFAFHKTSIFKKNVIKNYVTWNMPFWISYENDEIDMLNYKKASFPVLKYRVHSGNYINNELGKMNVINGELRTALQLMKYFHVKNYKKQYVKFRLFNKLKNNCNFKVDYVKEETPDKFEVIDFIVNKRYPDGCENNIFLKSLLSFYQKHTKRVLNIPKIAEDVTIYAGKDIRFFNKNLMNQSLHEFYMFIMNEMEKGFDEISVVDEIDAEKMRDVIKFMCISHVNIKMVK